MQITEPKGENGRVHLKLTEEPSSLLKLLSDLLTEESSLKESVNFQPLTVDAGVDSLLGAMLTDGSETLMPRIFDLCQEINFQTIQQFAAKRGWNDEYLQALKNICDEIHQLDPFAHRTTVQGMLNGHTKESSDRLLGKSFQQSMEELDAAGYKPPEVVINQDPHFAEFRPSFRNGEIRQVLIGGHSTLKTGYQFNMTNVSPLGLYNAIDLAPKRQEDNADLGDLRFAVVYGKAIERVKNTGTPLKHLQGDRELSVLGVFAISQQHAWPAISGELDNLSDVTDHAFLVTPWTSSRMTKTDLIASAKFAEVSIKSSEILCSQYTGDQLLVQQILGEDHGCKVTYETACLTLRKKADKYCEFNASEVQAQLAELSNAVKENEKFLETLKNQYYALLRTVNPSYTDRGLGMKLNAKNASQLTNEPADACDVRRQHRRIQGVIRRSKRKLEAFLREFQIFEIGVDQPTLVLLKGSPCHERTKIISFLKSCCKDYVSRWCIESGFELIEYQFPLHYYGNSSDTHVRCYVVQAIVFNAYRVAQILHIGATKPPNWRPWDPRKKLCCRRFSNSDRQSFTAKGYLLSLLHEALSNYFCRALN
jgi:hypothetical protein